DRSAVIAFSHPSRNPAPKEAASTLLNVPKTGAKCKLEGQSRTLSRRGDRGRKMREAGFSAWDCQRRCKRTDDHLLARRGTSTRKADGGLFRRLGSGRSATRFRM